jgi:signal transduction histidine kinase
MSLRTRLFLAFGGVSLLVLAPALFAVSRLTVVRNIAIVQRGRNAVAVEALGRLQAALAEYDRNQRSYVALSDATFHDSANASLAEAHRQLARIGGAGYADVAPQVATRLDQLDSATTAIDELMQSGLRDQATAGLEQAKPLLKSVSDALGTVFETIDRRSLEQVNRARAITEQALTGTLAVVAIALLLSLLISLATTRSLNRPLRRLRDATRDVAAGNFVVHEPLEPERRDEIGDLTRAFQTMTERLAELDRLKAEFVSVASHELKTPINVIGGYADLLSDGIYGAISSEQGDVLARIREQIQNLTLQVNQLLDVSRFEAGGLRLQLAKVALDDIMGDLRRSFEPLAEQKQIRFVTDICQDAPHSIMADPDRLRNEVLGNLLSNAFKFTPEGGAVTVQAARLDTGHVRIDVSDTGVGIPASDLPLIFDKFYQVGADARRKGSGLGLAIARQVTRAHGGELSAESRAGHGTTFHIVLPADGCAPTGGLDSALKISIT